MRSRLLTLLAGLTLSAAAAMNGLPSSALSAQPALIPTTLSAFAGQNVYLLPEDGVLLVPPGCRTQACPLLTLSHTRGRTPLELLESSSFQPFVRRLLAAKLPVLLSAEGGPDGWGGPEALWQLTRDHTLSRSAFKFSGRTYALGVSMGGMSALRAAVDAVFEVQGLILIDGRVSLKDAWSSGKSRKPELSAAYGLGDRAPAAHEDPLGSLPRGFRLPLLVFGSPQDGTVNFARNGAALYARAAGSGSSLIRTAGPHLGGSHLSVQVADQVVAFVQGLQARK